MSVKLLTEHLLQSLCSQGGYTGQNAILLEITYRGSNAPAFRYNFNRDFLRRSLQEA